jgi:hypothetical protein
VRGCVLWDLDPAHFSQRAAGQSLIGDIIDLENG